jgi:hypothetical protein
VFSVGRNLEEMDSVKNVTATAAAPFAKTLDDSKNSARLIAGSRS